MFVGLMVAIFGKMFEMKWLAYLGLVILLTGAFVFAIFGFLFDSRPRRRAASPANFRAPERSIEKADTTNKLLPVGETDYVPSVIEKTTELLGSPKKQ